MPHFATLPKLTSADVQTLVAWVDAGAREGDAADKPAKDPAWHEGWRIQPDVVVAMPQAYTVNAKGQREIRRFIIQSPFKEDTWVSAIEIKPGDTSVVHHAILQVKEPGAAAAVFARAAQGAAASAAPAVAQNLVFQARVVIDRVVLGGNGNGGGYNDMLVRLREQQTGEGAFMTMEAIYAPGTQPMDFRYTDSAKLIPGGKPMVLEVHYTPNGKATTDKTQVAFTLAKAPAARRFMVMAREHLVDETKPIPANSDKYETVGNSRSNRMSI